jgi:hypothetical protein
MKKTIFALPCMAAIALAAFVGMRTLERNKNINETLLMANVEALTEEEEGIDIDDCFSEINEGDMDWAIKCDPRTSYKKIFNCSEKQHFVLGLRGSCKK